MTQPRSDASAGRDAGPDAGSDLTALFDAVGITVTAEGKRRARTRLDEARSRWTPESWEALRAQVGRPSHAA
jgi:hypothetical protein